MKLWQNIVTNYLVRALIVPNIGLAGKFSKNIFS